MLGVDSLSAWYGAARILYDLSFGVGRGEVVALPLKGVIDLAAERGGNCELTRLNERVTDYGVTIIGYFNLASTIAYHASQMYGRNVTAFILHLLKDGKLNLDPNDEITRETMVARAGAVVHPVVAREATARAS